MAKKKEDQITWVTEKRRVDDLIDNPKNPRTLSKKTHKELLDSFEKFGYCETVAINLDNMIIAGHQRTHIMKELGWGDREIEVRVPCRKLTQKEAESYLLISNKVTGDFDMDLLANEWEIDFLCENGFTLEELGLGDDISIDEVNEVNESCNFTIKCDNIQQLEELKDILDISATKISFDKFVKKVDL